MIKSEVLSVQARTAAAWDSLGNPVNASVFSAFAVEVPGSVNQTLTSDRAFLEMNENRQGKYNNSVKPGVIRDFKSVIFC